MGSHDDLAAIRADTTEIKVTLARHEAILERNSKDLAEHMHRTLLLEGFTSRMSGIWTALGAVATLAGLIAAVLKVVEFLAK